MKRLASFAGIVALAAMISTSAYAVNKETSGTTKSQDFYEKTAPLRTALAADQAEFNALMAGTNPDPQRVRALAEKMTKAQDELRSIAGAYVDPLVEVGNGHHVAMHGGGHSIQEPHMNGAMDGYVNNQHMGGCR